MGLHAYLMVLVAGSALVALWLVVRLPKLGPTSTRGAGLCFVAAWLVPALAAPLFTAALVHMSAGPALLVAVFPVLGATFVLVGLALRYVVGLLGHAAR